MTLLELFCQIDDFATFYEAATGQRLLTDGSARRHRSLSMHPSEIMTILIHFHQSHYRNFKQYYLQHVSLHLRSEFPHLPSYSRFVEWTSLCLLPLVIYLVLHLGPCTGISFVDSTKISVCHNRRISQHKTFQGLAARGKTSVDWFYGFKLHLLLNDRGELIWFQLTAGNVDDRKSLYEMIVSPKSEIFGKIFGDKGYISQSLFEKLLREHHIQLVTGLKKNMHTDKPNVLEDAVLLRKRSVIETIIDQLKNVSQIEHSRHRSPTNFLVNLVCGLIAYGHQDKRPAFREDPTILQAA